ncbi:DUF1003 domain-containing protein [Agromyces sp. NPDC058110]|uniref:DUF1003 domain-containing protein n=1 Tax=Agromyces sp. NPDC058110 TaxID=3346345 RepID=UPI0036DE7B21
MSRPIVNWHDLAEQRRKFGERAADALRNGMGSWTFVGAFIVFMVVWAVLNSSDDLAWDIYPFILLNLFLSMLAGLQGAILLIAAKRQDALSAALAQHDYETNVAAAAEIAELRKANEEQTEMIRELVAFMRDQQGRPIAEAPRPSAAPHPSDAPQG